MGERFRNAVINTGLVVAPTALFSLFMSFTPDGAKETAAGRIDYCIEHEAQAPTLDQMLSYCLTAPADVYPYLTDTTPVHRFEIGTQVEEIVAYSDALRQDAGLDIEDFTEPASEIAAAFGAAFGGLTVWTRYQRRRRGW